MYISLARIHRPEEGQGFLLILLTAVVFGVRKAQLEQQHLHGEERSEEEEDLEVVLEIPIVVPI